MARLPVLLLAAVMVQLAAPAVHAGEDPESRPLKFARHASSATVKSTLQGRQTIDYTLSARSGQTMSVTLVSSNGGLGFNVLPPGSKDVALPDAIGRQSWQGSLPADGEYRIRTYLVRAAARRGERAPFTLTVSVTGAATTAAYGGTASRAAQGRFNATGKIPCAQHRGQPAGQCDFGVARAGGGTATVAVSLPDGRRRLLFFENGRAVGTDHDPAGDGAGFRATREADLNLIKTGDERYEVPDAVVFGG